MTLARLIATAALLVVGLAIATCVQAKESPITIRLKASKGQIETFYRGQRLSDAKLAQLCAAHRDHKDDINFQRDKMSSVDTVTALLKEADCLGAKRVGLVGVDRHPAPHNSATQTHAKQRRTKGKPQ